MLLPEFDGVIGITLHRNPFRTLQIYTSKNLIEDAKRQGSLIKWESLSCEGE